VSWNFAINDPQQRQHFFMAMLLVIAEAAELAQIKKQFEANFGNLLHPLHCS
jgi:hypothetical protein